MELQTKSIARAEIESVLDRLRPGLVADGGNVELIDVEADGTVRVSMQGACDNCPAQAATLRYGLEEPLRQALPGILTVIPA